MHEHTTKTVRIYIDIPVDRRISFFRSRLNDNYRNESFSCYNYRDCLSLINRHAFNIEENAEAYHRHERETREQQDRECIVCT